MRRVVITGIGLTTPLGKDVKSSWGNLIAGKSGIKNIPQDLFDTSDLLTKIAGLVPSKHEEDGLDLEQHISNKESNKMDRFIHLALVAAIEAIEDSGWLPSSEEDKIRTGVVIGSGIGGLAVIEDMVKVLLERGARRVSPFFIPASLINLASGHIAIKYGFKGPNQAFATACSSGAHAIIDAARLIALGDAEVMVAGGSEAAVCRIGIAGFNACKALSTTFNDTPHKASRPWDDRRDGFVMGEGAGVMILEEYEHAKKRGAQIYAEVAGYGVSGDAYHMTSPSIDGDGAFRAMSLSLQKAQINPEDVDYINAHGTSTPIGDTIELSAVQRLFNEHSNSLLMSSTKSAIGHLLGAAGSVEAIFSILSLRDSIAPATLNLESPPLDCKVDLVANTPKERNLQIVLSNSFGFGGTNASLIFKKL